MSWHVGRWRVRALGDGTKRLDGDAVWGVATRTTRARWTPPAAGRTIPIDRPSGPRGHGDPGGRRAWSRSFSRLPLRPIPALLEEAVAVLGLAREERDLAARRGFEPARAVRIYTGSP